VTLGLSRLQGLLRTLQPGLTPESELFLPARRILLLPAPGEQHTLGLVVVEEFFRGAGWEVSGGPGVSGSDAGDLVRAGPYDVVGLSLACETRLESLALCIRRVRKASCNKDVRVMVGGNIFVERPELATLIGADTTARDGRAAVSAAENLLGLTALAAR
jgi:methanogenic corrinoid protein MtbC1